MTANNSRLHTLSQSPMVLETPLDVFVADEINNEDFFIRSHFDMPDINTRNWKLSVTELNGYGVDYTYERLMAFPKHEVTVTLECAGNSRSSVQPSCEGMLWNHGGVGRSNWSGVSVQTLLAQMEDISESTHVLFLGHDSGNEDHDGPVSNYGMSIPLSKAMDVDTILAYEMNGRVLPQAHGYPMRLIVPGWYGMASVKWVTGIRIVDKPHDGFHQSKYYVYVTPGMQEAQSSDRVSVMKVKSLITSIKRGQRLKTGVQTIHGKAWSGSGPIQKVEISTDNGNNWQITGLAQSQSKYDWQHWSYDWTTNSPGRFLISVRATDSLGNVQPKFSDWNFRGFSNNGIHVVPVEIV